MALISLTGRVSGSGTMALSPPDRAPVAYLGLALRVGRAGRVGVRGGRVGLCGRGGRVGLAVWEGRPGLGLLG